MEMGPSVFTTRKKCGKNVLVTMRGIGSTGVLDVTNIRAKMDFYILLYESCFSCGMLLGF